MRRTIALHAVIITLALGAMGGCSPPALSTPATSHPERLVLATTTSTEDSGLLAHILPHFEAKHGSRVDVVAVGTGQAIEIASAGDADVILVHSRSREDKFVAEGHGEQRHDVMYNDFVVIGPAGDPAEVKGMASAAAAFAKIADARATFVSRGDDSGTHVKEESIWREAGLEPSAEWYVSAGQGMGAVLTMANEQLAYTLTDRGTYLARKAEGLSLAILVEGDPMLRNPYGVIPVSADRHPDVNHELADRFVRWLIGVETQSRISEFGTERFGRPLFTPDSDAWRRKEGLGPR